MTRFYDLSQPISAGMSYYPGDPEPSISIWPEEPPWQVSALYLGTHSGTHIDAPSHYGFPGSISAVSLNRLVGRGVVINATGLAPGDLIGLERIGAAEPLLKEGIWAIFCTGWDRHWGTPAYLDHPSLDPDLASQLVAWQVPLVAVDMLNPDSTAREEAVIHEILLGNGTLIAENLTGLERLEANRAYMFSMLPLKLEGLDGSPVRAIAWDGDLD